MTDVPRSHTGGCFTGRMKTDLVLAPLGAHLDELLAAAHAADTGGFDTVWTYDHFSGLVDRKPWSRDPFVTLGAIAATTSRINVGLLVANPANRHPVQLACAINSLQSLAPGRVLLGIGSGSSPKSQWSAEHAALGAPLPGAAVRRAQLAETVAVLRAVWRGEAFDGDHYTVTASMAVTDGTELPPIVIGGRTDETVAFACDHADGMNLLAGDFLDGEGLDDIVGAIRSRAPEDFEVSVFAPLELDHPLGGDPEQFATLGIDRRTLWVQSPIDASRIEAIAANLAAAR